MSQSQPSVVILSYSLPSQQNFNCKTHYTKASGIPFVAKNASSFMAEIKPILSGKSTHSKGLLGNNAYRFAEKDKYLELLYILIAGPET